MPYRQKLHCSKCGNTWTRIVNDSGGVAPSCPVCNEPDKKIGMNFNSGKAPSIKGNNTTSGYRNRGIDMAFDVAAHDYNQTDLRDNVREGDSMVKPLRPDLQKQVDNFFNGGNLNVPNASIMRRKKNQDLLNRAVNGAFKGAAVDVKKLLPDSRVGMKLAGTEIINSPKK